MLIPEVLVSLTIGNANARTRFQTGNQGRSEGMGWVLFFVWMSWFFEICIADINTRVIRAPLV